jgi:hypothetical protein
MVRASFRTTTESQRPSDMRIQEDSYCPVCQGPAVYQDEKTRLGYCGTSHAALFTESLDKGCGDCGKPEGAKGKETGEPLKLNYLPREETQVCNECSQTHEPKRDHKYDEKPQKE